MQETETNEKRLYAPLQLTVVGPAPESSEKWNIGHRLVTSHPWHTSCHAEASIETVWEIRQTDDENDHPKQRIAIYSGPDAPTRSLHISLQLPDDAMVSNHSCLQWTCFHTDKAKDVSPVLILACLVHSNAIILYDVYGGTSGEYPSDGWMVPLPFECRSIHAMDSGLLLQRMETGDDFDLDEHEHEFILQESPNIWQDSTSAPKFPVSFTGNTNPAVASLFTLHHPLEEVVPVSEHCANNISAFSTQQQPVTDVQEEVVWLDTAEWTNDADTKNVQQTTLMVTYHSQKRQHSVWVLDDAPSPPPLLPLYQQNQQHYTVSKGAFDWYDDDLHNPTDPPVAPHRVTHDEALADALGVCNRKNSSSTNTTTTTHANAVTAIPLASSRPRPQEGFFSPPGDVSHFDTTLLLSSSQCQQHHQQSPPQEHHHHHQLFHPLYPRKSIQCVYRDPCEIKDPASQVFFVSNLKGTGRTVLALQYNHVLTLLSLTPVHGGDRKTISVIPLDQIACIIAKPLQLCPSPTSIHGLITYILVLLMPDQLILYRANVPIVNCFVPILSSVSNLKDAVHNRVTVIDPNQNKLRTMLNLTLQCPIAEQYMSTIEAGLYRKDDYPIAIRIRVDCCRLEQSLDSRNGSEESFQAFRAVLISILIWQLDATQSVTWTSAGKEEREEEVECSAWEKLLQSNTHRTYSTCVDTLFTDDVRDETFTEKRLYSKMYSTISEINLLTLAQLNCNEHFIFDRILDSLHLLVEESKLTKAATEMNKARTLLVELFQIAQAMQPSWKPIAGKFMTYYSTSLDKVELEEATRRVKSLRLQSSQLAVHCRLTSFTAPPSIIEWIENKMKGMPPCAENFYDQVMNGSSNLNEACTLSKSILRVFAAITKATKSQYERDVEVVQTLLEEGLSDTNAIGQELQPGVAVPILETLYRLRNTPLATNQLLLSPQAWTLIGRKDQALNMSSDACLVQSSNVGSSVRNKHATYVDTTKFEDVESDGLVPLELTSAMLFPDDNRIHEAARLVRSSRPIFLRVPRAVEVTDHDYERLKQKRLMILAVRSLALPIGRGMLTLGSLRPVPAEPLPIPKLCLKGKVLPTNATLNLDMSEVATDAQVWPDFHNGVAAGLRLPLTEEYANLRHIITRTWVLHNKPPINRPAPRDTGDDAPPPIPQNYSNGGLLYALGLRGHLTVLEMSDFYDYLTQGTVTTTVGVLLGLAANKRGSCDISVSKMICLHIPSLIPQHFSAIDVASTVQAAAVSAAGLLYQGSASRLMTEFLLNEIGRRRESDMNTVDREAYTLACGLALGTVNLRLSSRDKDAALKSDGIADLNVEERLLRYIVGGVDQDESRRTRDMNDRFSMPSTANGSDTEKCSTIYEGDQINTDVTAPGATLALGLIYMKTENQTIASALALPDTHFLLDFVRPDFLGLRVIARSLILWNDVQPTDEWIRRQIPDVVRYAYEQIRASARSTYGLQSPQNHEKHACDFDRRAVRQMYVHVVAGACFGIGLRFAGTGNEEAKESLLRRVAELNELREAKDPCSASSRPEIPILETCIGTAAISLAMVLAGTGDLEALRLFKILRWHCEEESRYGIHMIYGMAIGLLFLGGGTCTIGREPDDIAALVTAFFPRFPTTTADNKYHLQALRHLYALATKQRELRAIDVDTGEEVYVPIQIKSDHMSNLRKYKVPCLLCNSDSLLKELEVLSDKYYPLKLNLSERTSSFTFFVKKRSTNGVTKLRFPQCTLGIGKAFDSMKNPSIAETLKGMTNDPLFLAIADYYIQIGSSLTPQNRLPSDTDLDLMHRALLECAIYDTSEALSVYVSLCFGLISMDQHTLWWNIGLIRTYYQGRSTEHQSKSMPLLNTQLLLPYMQVLFSDQMI